MHAVMKKIEEYHQPVPCLFYPVVRQTGAKLAEVLRDAQAQADILIRIAAEYPVGAVVRMTELWCEAAAFGMECRFSDKDFPVLGDALCEEAEELDELELPTVHHETLAPLIEAVRLASAAMDRPLIVGMTGPYTLGAVLGGSEDFMVACMTEPETVHSFLEKLCGFLIDYAKAYKEAGAAGILIAEPSTAMISPDMMQEFSNQYLSRIIDAVQDDTFAVIYHNCGAADRHMSAIAQLDAAAFHFGSEIDMIRARNMIAEDRVLMGNLDPRVLLNASAETVEQQTEALCGKHRALPHWIASTGCDLSPAVPAAAVEAFLRAACK